MAENTVPVAVYIMRHVTLDPVPSMEVGQDGEAMDHVQSHAEVERRLNTGVVILPLQDMVATVVLDPAHPVPHATQIHVQFMAVGRDGEAMDRVQRHVEVERKLNPGVVILPLQDMAAELALDPVRPVLHVTPMHVQ